MTLTLPKWFRLLFGKPELYAIAVVLVGFVIAIPVYYFTRFNIYPLMLPIALIVLWYHKYKVIRDYDNDRTLLKLPYKE